MDLWVVDLKYRLEQTQKHLKGNSYLSQIYKEDIKEIEKLILEIDSMVDYNPQKNILM